MHFSKLAFVSALAAFAVAQEDVPTTDIDLNNVPAECTDSCAQVAAIVNGCDTDNNDDDEARLDCICTAGSAESLITECGDCIQEFSSGDDSGDDDGSSNVMAIMNACGWDIAPVATETNTVSVTDTVIDTNTNTETVTNTDTRTSVAIIITSTGTEEPTSTGTGAAAPGATAGAAMGLGALGFALGML